MSIAPIVLELLVRGAPAVSQSMRGVAETMSKAERQMQRDAERASKSRTQTATNEARDKVRAWLKMDAEVKRIHDRSVKETERSAKAETRIVDQAAREKLRFHQQAQREVERIQERGKRAAISTIQAESRERERAAAKWVRDEEANAKRVAGTRERVSTAMIGAAGRGAIAGANRVGSMTFGLANTAAQLGGGFSIADSVTRESNMRKQAAVLAASTQMAESGMRRMDTGEILSTAKGIGVQHSIDPAEVLKSFDEIKKLTGDMDKAMQVAPSVAKLATATGGSVSDMSGLAANILAADPKKSAEDVDREMRIFARQGVVGGVEISDFAKYGSRLTAGASLFGGDKTTNQASMGAIAQIARQYGGAASPAEATLASQRFATDVAKHSGALNAKGIKVSDGKGNLRDAKSILMDMLDKTGGDVTKLGSMGLGERGVRALTGVSAIYKDAGGGAKGKSAVEAEFKKYTTGVSDQELKAAEDLVLKEHDLDRALEELRIAAGEQLLPVFKDMLPAIKDLIPLLVMAAREGIPAFTDLLRTVTGFATAHKGIIADIAAHPIGAIMAFEVTKSIASAAIGDVIKRILTGGGGGVPGGVPGVVPGGGGNAVPQAATMLATLAVVGNAAEKYQAGTSSADEMAAKLRDRTMSPATAQAEIARAQANVDAGSVGRNTLALLASPIVPDANKEYTELKRDQAIIENENLQKALADAVVALNQNTAATNASGARGDGNSGPGGAARTEPIINR